MHVIYEALKKTSGKTDGDALIAAAKGMKWESPRGPMSIDPETRDVVQTIYIRKVEKVDGEPQNVDVRQGRERQGSGQGPDEVSSTLRATLGGWCRRAAAWRWHVAAGIDDTMPFSTEEHHATRNDRACRLRRRPARRHRAHAQGTVKIGVIMTYSGQFADPGAQMDNGIKLYMKEHGDTVAGKKIEFIRKDTGGIAPDVAKRLAQELIVRDKVDILAGFALTPNALAVGRRVGAGQEVHGQHERGDLDHHDQVALHGAHLVHRAAGQRGARHLGLQERHPQGLHDGLRLRPGPRRRSTRSRQRFKEAGGEIVGSVRFPVANPDFSAFVQRAKDANPDVDLHLGARRRAAGGARQGARRARHRPEEDQGLGQGELTYDDALKSMGDAGARHHHRLPLRPQPQVGDEQGVRRRPTTPSSSATPTCSRSAAMTACT